MQVYNSLKVTPYYSRAEKRYNEERKKQIEDDRIYSEATSFVYHALEDREDDFIQIMPLGKVQISVKNLAKLIEYIQISHAYKG